MELLVWSQFTLPTGDKPSKSIHRHDIRNMYPIGPPYPLERYTPSARKHHMQYRTILFHITHHLKLEKCMTILAHIYLYRFHIETGRVYVDVGVQISIAAMTIAIKMLSDHTGDLNSRLAILTNHTTHQINTFEIGFLETIDFNTHVGIEEYNFMKDFMEF